MNSIWSLFSEQKGNPSAGHQPASFSKTTGRGGKATIE